MVHLASILIVGAVLLAAADLRLVSLERGEPGIPGGAVDSTIAALAPPLVLLLVAALCVRAALRRLDRGRALPVLPLLRIIRRLPVALVVFHAMSLLVFDWLGVIRSVVGNPVAIDETLAVLVPVAALAGLWWLEYPLERRIREALLIRQFDAGEPVFPIPSRAEFVLGQVRLHAAFTLIPVLLIVSAVETAEHLVPRTGPCGWLSEASALVALLLVIACAPLLAERILPVRALGPGPLREDIDRLCLRHRVRIGRTLVWHTGGAMVNAAVMGLLPRLRRLILTDALLELLERQQIRAVVAHEMGHVRHRHLPWLLLAVLATLLATTALAAMGIRAAGELTAGQFRVASFAALVLSLAVMLPVFGWVSRRFERQADLFAARSLGPGTLSEAPHAEAVAVVDETLAFVSRLNGADPDHRSWRHGSIAARQGFLREAARDSGSARRADRTVRAIKAAVLLLLAVSISGHVLLLSGHSP